MSRSTSGIATILLVAASTDSFALGGVVAGAVVAGIAVGGPLWARSVDRFGQRRVLPWAITALALSAAALGTAITLDAAPWTWFVLAFALGASSIDTGSLVRARWAGVLRTPGERHTALALEAVGDELSFVIGPPLATILAAALAPIYGFAAGVGIATLGALWLLLQPATMPALHPPVARTRRAGWLPQGVGAALPLYPGVGLVFGSIDVSVVAVGSEAGNSALAGIILAIFSIGSVAAGLAFGQLSAAWSPTTRVWVAALGYAVLVPLLLLGTTPVLLAAFVFVTGLATTPVLISGASLIESRVHRSRLTEAMA
jgi:predicted MFS family arabinose efflux permease